MAEKEKKRILIATDCFAPRWDGIARFLHDVLPELTDMFEITVIAPDFPGSYEQIDSIKIIRIPLLKQFHFGDYTPAKREARTIEKEVKKHDIVWVHTFSNIGLVASQMAKRHKKPYLVYVHSIDWMLVYKALKTVFRKALMHISKYFVLKRYQDAQLLMVPSLEVHEILRWNSIKTPMHVISLGVDTDRFVRAVDKQKAKQRIGFSKDDKIIGYVGRLSREKDVYTLYRAFLQVQKRIPNAKLLIVGDGTTELKSRFEKHANIIHVGSQNDVLPYMQALDVHVLPSHLETTSLCTLEAMSCEVPVINTPVGLAKEYIKEKQNGFFFPKSNSTVLALKLEWLLKEPLIQESIGKRARETVIKHYNLQKTIQTLKTLLQ
ncbi:MAG: glycosyltransferase family 4 protein [Candidatus Woesearchaeota archaeon]